MIHKCPACGYQLSTWEKLLNNSSGSCCRSCIRTVLVASKKVQRLELLIFVVTLCSIIVALPTLNLDEWIAGGLALLILLVSFGLIIWIRLKANLYAKEPPPMDGGAT